MKNDLLELLKAYLRTIHPGIIACGFLAATAVLVYKGYDIAGFVFGIVAFFILGKFYQRKAIRGNSDHFNIN